MTVNRAQYLQGDLNQGRILVGQPQGVKQGSGIAIGGDGVISFNAATSMGVVRLNNPLAFNSYVWPDIKGSGFERFCILSSGNLGWAEPKGLVNLGYTAPFEPVLGEQWFDYYTDLTYVLQNKQGSASWQPIYRGLDPLELNCSAVPAFSSGYGTPSNPYLMNSSAAVKGEVVFLPSAVTITGLAPYQYVPIRDTDSLGNGGRFQVTSSFANGEGALSFKVKFTDSPKSSTGTSYTARFSIGFDHLVYINATVTLVDSLSILSPGAIAGVAQVGEALSYTLGSATGGVPPFSYSWVWKLESSNTVLQTNGANYTLSNATVGGRVYVQLLATDSNLFSASGETAKYPSPPSVIEKGDFPNTNIGFPSTIPGIVSTNWLDIDSELRADGCIEFATDGLTFNQGPTLISNGGTIYTRWVNISNCAGADNGATISGCIYSNVYKKCDSLVVDRVPSPFTFNPVTDIVPGSVATSQSVVPVGYNSTTYVTYNASSTGSNIQASTDNGLTWVNLPLVGGTSVPLNPGNTLRIRLTTGLVVGASYTASVNLGSGSTFQTSSFTATNSLVTTFSTPISFPSTTLQEAQSTPWLAGDGSTNLSATGCIQFKVGSGGAWTGAGSSAVPVTTGDILYTRWSNSTPSVCGNAIHGSIISGSITNIPSGGTKTNSSSLTIDRVPSPFAFTDLTGQALSTIISSDIINISGINAPTYITLGSPSTLASIEASVNGAPWVSIPLSGETLSLPPVPTGSGSALQIRGFTGPTVGATYTATLNIGQNTSINTDTWNVTTVVSVPSIATPSITSPVNGATNANPNLVSPPGITVSSSIYTPLNGAGSQVSSDWEIYYMSGGSPVYVVQVSGDVVNLQSYFLPVNSLIANTTYSVRVRYNTSTPSLISSNWSTVSQFKTISSFLPQFVRRRYVNGFPDVSATNPATGGYTLFLGWYAENAFSNYRSMDGITLEQIPAFPGATNSIMVRGLAYGSNKFVAIPGQSSFYSSDNGLSWTKVMNIAANKVAYSPTLNLFCAVTYSTIYTSPGSSINWTYTQNFPSTDLTSIIWDGTAFRACGGTYLLTSTDGINWTYQVIPLAPDGSTLDSITHNPLSGRYIISRRIDLNQPTIYMVYSDDCITWTTATAPEPISCMTAGGALFLAGSGGGNNANIYSSYDGITWTLTYTSYYGGSVANLGYIASVNRFYFINGYIGNSSFFSTT